MNSESELSFEEVKQLADEIVFKVNGSRLSDLETKVLRGAYEGKTYEVIANELHRSESHINKDVGNPLWRKLSKGLGEDVSKTSFREALKRYWKKQISEDQNTQPQIPDEYRMMIAELTQPFYGREGVFEVFEQFCEQNHKGYFIVVGEPGMGKSAIAAKYVKDYDAVCFFNVQAEGHNTPDLFLNQMRRQLKRHYQLQDVEQENLRNLLQQASGKLQSGKRLVVVVDALDEVARQNPTENLLYLPKTLPNGVYFLLTRRPYSLETNQLIVLPGTSVEELDLTVQEYEDFNQRDIKKCVQGGLNGELPYVDKVALEQWVKARYSNQEKFVEEFANKSEQIFIYARLVLQAIARGDYNDQQLPQGLKNYYEQQWKRIGIDEDAQKLKLIVLFILMENCRPISSQTIAEISEQEEYKVCSVLKNQLCEFLRGREFEEELCYSFFHASFLDFLRAKKELDKNRKELQYVHRRFVEFADSWEDEDE